ncbi:MAG: hypothetical protein OEQ53_13660 [Saprospiraceae bacterium]|nr:hypothetical protein [Saprospiraceae bacterium]
MRFYIPILLMIIVLACQKDDNAPDPVSGDNALHYDGSNQSAPVVARGISYAAARFPENELSSRAQQGKNITAIDYYIAQEPDAIRLLVLAWNEQDATQPGPLMYEASLPGTDFSGNQWNRHTLTGAVPIPEAGIWIAFEVQAGDRDLSVIGCDLGPHHPHGDVYGIFGDSLPGWTSLSSFTNNQIDINWNIRAVTE